MPRRDVEAKAYLSPDEVAELLGLSLRTVMRRIDDGTIPAVKVGRLWRVQRADLDRALAAEPVRRRPGRRPR